MRHALAALVGTALLLGSGCSAGTKPEAISGDALAKKVSALLAEQAGQTPDDVSCPDDLPAEKGAEVRCVLTAGSDKLGVTVTTTSVDDDGQVNFDAEVDQEMMN
ncbi:hypothetical protein ASG49_13515 [Marmoricola sp. Leaf446]|uniref:DUF4333 domain-containing protein n=1 Tax=Marmoricola sp. Leaf446 TaxID=1736379 RepID=UPI0006FF29D7|nr:DUF4333 domain-containing protein [Marmoricola sp. Leaf446]KQT90760.1 hypothetical protein ASG49_13515 [Marmoricola sp. Leaf446]